MSPAERSPQSLEAARDPYGAAGAVGRSCRIEQYHPFISVSVSSQSCLSLDASFPPPLFAWRLSPGLRIQVILGVTNSEHPREVDQSKN